MKAYTSTFAARSGTGTQVVSGIVDENSVAFVPKVIIFHGNSPANAALANVYRRFHGMDDGTVRLGQSTECASASGGKISSYFSSGSYSIIDGQAAAINGGIFERRAYISALASGSFTLQYDQNDRTGDSIGFTALGGDDLSYKAGWTNNAAGAPIALGFTPTAIMLRDQTQNVGGGSFLSSGSTAMTFGWGISGHAGTMAAEALSQAGNHRYQTASKAAAWSDGSLGRSVSAFGASSFTLDGTGAYGYLALGGIQAAAGTLVQRTTTGSQTISTGINPKVILFVSAGEIAAAGALTDYATLVMGMADQTRQHGTFAGMKTVGNTLPLAGSSYFSGSTILRFGTPAASTSFSNVAAITSVDLATGIVTLNWSAVDGAAREVYWLALGDLLSPPAATVTGLLFDCSAHLLTVTGTNFLDGATIVVQGVNGVVLATTTISFTSTQIVLSIPTYAGGAIGITVTNT